MQISHPLGFRSQRGKGIFREETRKSYSGEHFRIRTTVLPVDCKEYNGKAYSLLPLQIEYPEETISHLIIMYNNSYIKCEK